MPRLRCRFWSVTSWEQCLPRRAPFFRPWTFKIMRHGSQCGVISKRWGGLGREMFTDADAFGIEFPKGISAALKAVFVGAVFLIDFAHFEDNAGN